MMRMPTALGCMLSGIRVSLISNLLPSSVSDRNACNRTMTHEPRNAHAVLLCTHMNAGG